jgi:phosphoserine phosphatase
MKKLCAQLDIPLENTVAVGDGANDVPMLSAAGVAVVYNAISAKKGIDEVISKIV